MSTTAVPISIRLVRAPTAASSGNGDPSCLAKWCTRKYAPSAPSSSAATARSIDCSNASDADRVCEPGDDDQCPNDKNPIFFTSAITRAARTAFLASKARGGVVPPDCQPARPEAPADPVLYPSWPEPRSSRAEAQASKDFRHCRNE